MKSPEQTNREVAAEMRRIIIEEGADPKEVAALSSGLAAFFLNVKMSVAAKRAALRTMMRTYELIGEEVGYVPAPQPRKELLQ